MHRFSFVVCFIGTLVFAGCRSDLPQTYSASGAVTLNGKPLPNVIVTFLPVSGGRSASGTADSQGSFRLSTFGVDDGAMAGKYEVTIIPKDPPPMAGDSDPGMTQPSKPTKYTPPFPGRYGMPKESKLTAEITKGPNKFTFDLQSK
jgi:hypothetical protein